MIYPVPEHPYPRYGLAVALTRHAPGESLSQMEEKRLREILIWSIEDGLEHFRMEAVSPLIAQGELVYRAIKLDTLRQDANLVQKSGLSKEGRYLFPSVVTSDGSAKGTFGDAEVILTNLHNEKIPLDKKQDLKRSVAPIAGEVNNGGNEKKNQRGTLLEAACAIIATITAYKPAAMQDGSNTGIYPDLDLMHLCEFVRVFIRFQSPTAGGLMKGKASDKGEYIRPPLHRGNYPEAPRDSAFGPVGLLASIGYWAQRAEEDRPAALRALDSLTDCPLYLVSYDSVKQAQFSHYVIELAKSGHLKEIVDDLYRHTRLFSEFDEPRFRRDLPVYKHFYFALNRFLQRFDRPAFRDFLMTRAEYPYSTGELLEVYFTQMETISPDIVTAARALGQWLNRTAYFAAKEDSNDEKAIRKEKAKILTEFESAIMSATSASDMLSRVSTRAGRLLLSDAPPEATAFYDASNIGAEISLDTAKQLLIAYLRLRPKGVAASTEKTDVESNSTDSTGTSEESEEKAV
jgi:hypothetical protein